MRTSYTLQEVRVHRDILIPLHAPSEALTARQFLELAGPSRTTEAAQLLGSAAIKEGVYVGYTKDRKTFALAPADRGASIAWVLRQDPEFGARVERIWRVVGMAPPRVV